MDKKCSSCTEGLKRFFWRMNYHDIAGVTYPRASYRKLRYYLMTKIDRYYRRKSQRRCKRLHGQAAFSILVKHLESVVNLLQFFPPQITQIFTD